MNVLFLAISDCMIDDDTSIGGSYSSVNLINNLYKCLCMIYCTVSSVYLI